MSSHTWVRIFGISLGREETGTLTSIGAQTTGQYLRSTGKHVAIYVWSVLKLGAVRW